MTGDNEGGANVKFKVRKGRTRARTQPLFLRMLNGRAQKN